MADPATPATGEGEKGPPAAPPPRDDRLMLVLCYLGLLAVVPYLFAREREAVRFHARQGLALGLLGVLCAAVAVIPAVGFFGALGIAGCVVGSILGIVKSLAGERWRMPVAADVADRLAL
jgi:uncharacterized membrane protein